MASNAKASVLPIVAINHLLRLTFKSKPQKFEGDAKHRLQIFEVPLIGSCYRSWAGRRRFFPNTPDITIPVTISPTKPKPLSNT